MCQSAVKELLWRRRHWRVLLQKIFLLRTVRLNSAKYYLTALTHWPCKAGVVVLEVTRMLTVKQSCNKTVELKGTSGQSRRRRLLKILLNSQWTKSLPSEHKKPLKRTVKSSKSHSRIHWGRRWRLEWGKWKSSSSGCWGWKRNYHYEHPRYHRYTRSRFWWDHYWRPNHQRHRKPYRSIFMLRTVPAQPALVPVRTFWRTWTLSSRVWAIRTKSIGLLWRQ